MTRPQAGIYCVTLSVSAQNVQVTVGQNGAAMSGIAFIGSILGTCPETAPPFRGMPFETVDATGASTDNDFFIEVN